MKQNYVVIQFILLSFLLTLKTTQACTINDQVKTVGVFHWKDNFRHGFKYGNWGSRPYEYVWISSVLSVQDKRLIDLGIGIPSQYDWYKYVVNTLKPSFYAGIDWDARILKELESGSNYELRHMSMADLQYPDKSFDVAYCISTFEHVEYGTFMKSMQEAHRVLTDDGLLLITLDEAWDKDQPYTHYNGWNTLELSLIKMGLFKRHHRSFGLPEFLQLIKDYFVLYNDDAQIDTTYNVIRSKKDNSLLYYRFDKDPTIINSDAFVNSCVSYAVLKKVDKSK